jgi:hypothetical protein
LVREELELGSNGRCLCGRGGGDWTNACQVGTHRMYIDVLCLQSHSDHHAAEEASRGRSSGNDNLFETPVVAGGRRSPTAAASATHADLQPADENAPGPTTTLWMTTPLDSH